MSDKSDINTNRSTTERNDAKEKSVDVETNGGNNGVDDETQPLNSKPLNSNEQQREEESRRSVLSRVRNIRAYEPIGFVRTFVAYLFGSIAGIIAVIIANAIQIIMIITGAVYINSCPNRAGIPIILIITGSVNLLLCIVESIKRQINTESNIIPKLVHTITAIKLLSAVSFLAWCVLVYDSPTPNYDDPNASNYCNRYLYLYAFWLLNGILIITGTILTIACCCCCWSNRVSNK